MSRTAIFVLSLIMLSGMVQISLVSSELADTPWPKFRHDLRNTGRSPYVGAQDNTLKWSYTTSVYSSPAIGADGTIYFASGYKLYAIGPGPAPTNYMLYIVGGAVAAVIIGIAFYLRRR